MGIFPCIITGLATVQSHSPVTASIVASLDPSLSTLHLYFPGSLPNTVSVFVFVTLVTVGERPSDNSILSRLQVIVVVGSPVKTQVRVNSGGSVVGVVRRLNWSGPVIITTPKGGTEKSNLQ